MIIMSNNNNDNNLMIIIILIIIVIVFIVISRIHTVKANSDGKKKKILQVFCGYLVVW